MRKKFLHLIPNEKFTNPYIEFINENFIEGEHLFLILGTGTGSKILSGDNIIELKNDLKSVSKIITSMNKINKIFLHGLFHPQLVFLLFLQPWLLKKCNWIVWGGDLYLFCSQRRTIKAQLYESIRRIVIKNLGGLITHVRGDYDLAKSWYGTRGKYYYSFMYPSNLYNEYDLSKIESNKDKTFILIGNSADPSNNHIDIFEKLLEYNDKTFEVICPLSYGDSSYATNVIKKGEALFDKNFTPITEYLTFEEYLRLVAKIDVAIFNHNRQQAVGNIITLLSLGKKVYIRDDITTWKFCETHSLEVFSTNNSFHTIFEPIEQQKQQSNITKMKEQFSRVKLIEDWNVIFSS